LSLETKEDFGCNGVTFWVVAAYLFEMMEIKKPSQKMKGLNW